MTRQQTIEYIVPNHRQKSVEYIVPTHRNKSIEFYDDSYPVVQKEQSGGMSEFAKTIQKVYHAETKKFKKAQEKQAGGKISMLPADLLKIQILKKMRAVPKKKTMRAPMWQRFKYK